MGQAVFLNKYELIITDAGVLLDRLIAMGKVISLVGAGGKSTLLYELASRCAHQGMNALVTTSTHIYHPNDDHFCSSFSQCEEKWRQNTYAVWADDQNTGKLTPLDPASFAMTLRADRVLIEADGARHFPCKAPALHEPQIPSETDTVVGVLGLSALGKRITEACLRADETARLLGCTAGHRLTPEDLAFLLSSSLGQRKHVNDRNYFAVLNQADLLKDQEAARTILQLLTDQQIPAALSCFSDQQIPFC